MRRFIIFVIAYLLISNATSAQPGPDTLWTRFYGWTGDDTAFSIKQTADHGFIIAGSATVPADGHTNAFLIKADSNGVMQGWHSYGGPGDEGAYDVMPANDGRYAFTGYATIGTGCRREYFVRVNLLGDTVCTYADTAQGLYQIWYPSLCRLPDNSFVAAYEYRFQGYLGGGFGVIPYPSLGCESTFSIDHSADGYIEVHRIHVTSGNSVTVVGSFADTIGVTPAAMLWKVMYNPWGEMRRVIGGGSYQDAAYDFVELPDGFVLAGATTDGQRDGIFICKTDTAGDPDWIHRYFTIDGQWAEAMVPAIGGGYVLVGTSVTYQGDTDMLLVKVNNDGQIVWQRNYGTPADERAYDLVQTADGGFVLAGYSTAHQGVGAEWYLVKTLPDPELVAIDPANLQPSSFRLSAYPNPFNPVTTLSFTLPKAGMAKITVYDVAGREVRTISNQVFEAGNHALRIDGSTLPSGIYFARLDAGKYSQTKKLMLLK